MVIILGQQFLAIKNNDHHVVIDFRLKPDKPHIFLKLNQASMLPQVFEKTWLSECAFLFLCFTLKVCEQLSLRQFW